MNEGSLSELSDSEVTDDSLEVIEIGELDRDLVLLLGDSEIVLFETSENVLFGDSNLELFGDSISELSLLLFTERKESAVVSAFEFI